MTFTKWVIEKHGVIQTVKINRLHDIIDVISNTLRMKKKVGPTYLKL